MTGLICLVVAYLTGGIPFGLLLAKWKTGRDVRQMGSGNIGATNVMRTAGTAVGVITLLLDIAKGYAAVWLASKWPDTDVWLMSCAAAAVMLGHAFPPYLRFQGGKSVATFVGAFLFLAPLPVAATVVVFGATVAVSRFVSLGSVLGAATFPLAVWLIQHPPAPVLLAAIFGGVFVVWRHKSNIERLRAGTENVLRLRGAKS
jgi:glycerol-3-phosphate acyltransferase PlsY